MGGRSKFSSESWAQGDATGLKSTRVRDKLNPKEDGAKKELWFRFLGFKGSEQHPHSSGSAPRPSGQGRQDGRRSAGGWRFKVRSPPLPPPLEQPSRHKRAVPTYSTAPWQQA